MKNDVTWFCNLPRRLLWIELPCHLDNLCNGYKFFSVKGNLDWNFTVMLVWIEHRINLTFALLVLCSTSQVNFCLCFKDEKLTNDRARLHLHGIKWWWGQYTLSCSATCSLCMSMQISCALLNETSKDICINRRSNPHNDLLLVSEGALEFLCSCVGFRHNYRHTMDRSKRARK
jgi:hypothetical protein